VDGPLEPRDNVAERLRHSGERVRRCRGRLQQGEVDVRVLRQPQPGLDPQRSDQLVVDDAAQGLAGDAAYDLTHEVPERDRVVVDERAGLRQWDLRLEGA
jgi:hypothetical protein